MGTVFGAQLGPANVHFCMTPQPWHRTGPGSAKTGSPGSICRASLRPTSTGFESALVAGNAGLYASVMLFEGFSLHLADVPDHIEGHPFHAANNSG